LKKGSVDDGLCWSDGMFIELGSCFDLVIGDIEIEMS